MQAQLREGGMNAFIAQMIDAEHRLQRGDLALEAIRPGVQLAVAVEHRVVDDRQRFRDVEPLNHAVPLGERFARQGFRRRRATLRRIAARLRLRVSILAVRAGELVLASRFPIASTRIRSARHR